MAYRLCPRVVFPSKKMFVEEVQFTLMERTLMTYVQPTLTTCTFDLWMIARVHDVFVVVNFLSNNWEPKHVKVNLFKVIGISGATMVLNYELSLIKFSSQKIIAYVKNEGSNL
jgi:hypothetical protein